MGTAQVLPGILQKHCCILPDRNTGHLQTIVTLGWGMKYGFGVCVIQSKPQKPPRADVPLSVRLQDAVTLLHGASRCLSGHLKPAHAVSLFCALEQKRLTDYDG
ncbi:PREDICTED: putative uncharacterized protein encoded by ERICH1-AS1 [Mandrillus leucophaeus]|uniref:putative uncharacterized protein encoded by ERICH1-AS1 n=1 Tax=Mandrillus leucophaeus TaxID=9568 RepID=UPI0005F361E3|nr:PREDICTED: putative uncharacterized protein encoded by ERICH1-AS1 [Mandrillus leucophaeus]